jgi:hypothetical protein
MEEFLDLRGKRRAGLNDHRAVGLAIWNRPRLRGGEQIVQLLLRHAEQLTDIIGHRASSLMRLRAISVLFPETARENYTIF